MITNKNGPKVMTKHTSCDCKCKFNNESCNLIQKWNNEICQSGCKTYRQCKKSYSWNTNTSICENSKYINETSAIPFSKIIPVIDIVSTKMTNKVK